MDRRFVVLLASFLVSACASPSTPVPVASGAVLSTIAPTGAVPPTITPTATMPSGEPVDACGSTDIRLSMSGFGPALGTLYAPIHVTPVNPRPCLVPATPAAKIVDADGETLALGPGSADSVVVLREGFDWRLAWASWCGPPPKEPLSVELTLLHGDAASAPLPAGLVASCQGVATTVYVEPVNPDLAIPAPPSPTSDHIYPSESASATLPGAYAQRQIH